MLTVGMLTVGMFAPSLQVPTFSRVYSVLPGMFYMFFANCDAQPVSFKSTLELYNTQVRPVAALGVDIVPQCVMRRDVPRSVCTGSVGAHVRECGQAWESAGGRGGMGSCVGGGHGREAESAGETALAAARLHHHLRATSALALRPSF